MAYRSRSVDQLTASISGALIRALKYCAEHVMDPNAPTPPMLTSHENNHGVLVFQDDHKTDNNLECLVLRACPVESRVAKKSRGRNSAVEYIGRYFASFSYLCSTGVFMQPDANLIDRTVRWIYIPELEEFVASDQFPSFYCRDTVCLFKTAANGDGLSKTLYLSLSINSTGGYHETNGHNRTSQKRYIPFHIVVKVTNTPKMPQTRDLPPVPYLHDLNVDVAIELDNDNSALISVSAIKDSPDYHFNNTTFQRSVSPFSDLSEESLHSNLRVWDSEQDMDPMSSVQDWLGTNGIDNDITDNFLSSNLLGQDSSPGTSLHRMQHDMPTVPRLFTGRAHMVEDVFNILTSQTPSLVWLTGVPGVGKSSVAAAITHKCHNIEATVFPDGVFYVDTRNHAGMHAATCVLSHIDFGWHPMVEQALVAWSARLTSPCLVIVDDLDFTMTDTLSWLWTWMNSPFLNVLITSNSKCPVPQMPSEFTVIHTIQVPRLPENESEHLLQQLFPDADQTAIQLARQSGIPFEIERLHAHTKRRRESELENSSTPQVKQTPHLDVDDTLIFLLLLFENEKFSEQLALAILGTHDLLHSKIVPHSVKLALHALKKNDVLILASDSGKMLRWNPSLREHYRQLAEATKWNGYEQAMLRYFAYYMSRFSVAIQKWMTGFMDTAIAIMDSDAAGFRRIFLQEEIRLSWLPLLSEIMVNAWTILAQWSPQERRTVYTRICEAAIKAQQTPDIRQLVAICYVYTDKVDDALQILHQLAENYGQTRFLLGLAYNIKGQHLAKEGRFLEALDVYNNAQQHFEVANNNSPDMATVWHNMSTIYQILATRSIKPEEKQSLVQQAIKHATFALNLRHRVLGESHPDTAMTLTTIAHIYESQNDLEQAHKMYQNALSVQEEVLGTLHPATSATQDRLGFILYKQGLYAKACELHQQSLKTRLALLDDNHADLGQSYYHLALDLIKLYQFRDAIPHLQRALDILGPDQTVDVIKISALIESLPL